MHKQSGMSQYSFKLKLTNLENSRLWNTKLSRKRRRRRRRRRRRKRRRKSKKREEEKRR